MKLEEGMFTASHRYARISPQKARLSMDLVRGKRAEAALTALQFSQRRASPMIRKVLQSAMANALQKSGVEGEDLVVWRAYVDEGPRGKRWRPRSMGRAYPRVRRTCHLSVVLKLSPGEKAKKSSGGAQPPSGDSSGDVKETDG